MLICLDETGKKITPEIGKLFRELEADEEVWKGKTMDNDWLALYKKAKLLKSLVIQFANESQNLSEGVLSLEAEKKALRDDRVYQVGEIATMKDKIRSLEREKDLAVETVFKLGADCQRKDEEIVALAGKNQKLLDRILWLNNHLNAIKQANIKRWVVEQVLKNFNYRERRSMPIFWGKVKEFIDSLRKDIDKISEELVAGIDLSEKKS